MERLSDVVCGIYSDVVEKEISAIMMNIITFLVVLALIGAIATYFLGVNITKGYIDIKNKLHSLESGNIFSIDVDEKILKRKDEIGDISRSFNTRRRRSEMS